MVARMAQELLDLAFGESGRMSPEIRPFCQIETAHGLGEVIGGRRRKGEAARSSSSPFRASQDAGGSS